MDNLLLMGSDREKISELKENLGSKFRIKDLGPAACFLGMQIERDRKEGKLMLYQRAYIEQLLKRYNLKSVTII